MPESPAIGTALKQTLALKLDGFVTGRDEELRTALRLLGHGSGADRIAPVPERWNAMQWDGEPGHYEVWYVTFTDPATGVGFWIRYTMVAPLPGTGEEATCSLWLMAMDPADPAANVGQKVSFPVSQLHATRRALRAAHRRCHAHATGA